MKYIIIGDIHGRTSWKQLVDDSATVIFVGDYFSPYSSSFSFDHCKDNFLEICQYKKEHPQTVLLIGNHDDNHWHNAERISRHDYINESKIRSLFEENKDLLTTAYSIQNKVLVTHAGVSVRWLMNALYPNNWSYKLYTSLPKSDTIEEAFNLLIKEYDNRYPYSVLASNGCIVAFNKSWWYNDSNNWIEIKMTPDSVADHVNDLWKAKKWNAFTFENNCCPEDYCGNSITQSPMWIRTNQLVTSNIFKFSNYMQVFGHTISKDFWFCPNKKEPKLVMVDCLEKQTKAFILDM